MIKAIKGTKDILPEDIRKWNHVEDLVKRIFANFNYKEVRTPVFEETSLFARGIGESTDIVGKEMYTFLDRSQVSVTLKPEMTAAVVRAFNEHSLGKKQVLNKLFYISPMFRQERQQLGRYRQFHQFGAEALGSHDPLLDAELIIIAYDILTELGLKNLEVKINSLGVPESRERYKELLRNYLADKLNELSEESRNRFNTNILRIFDSKVESDQQIMNSAPLLLDHLDSESLEHFDSVKNSLDSAGVPYIIDPKLVRGLDYYTHTTFEILSGSVGAQSALCGGGRYNLLVEQLGGAPTPGIGFAAGIERILLACENENSLKLSDESIDVYIVCLNRELSHKVFELAMMLRRNNHSVELDYSQRSVKAQMREANKLNAKFVLFYGGDEFEVGKFSLKNMISGDQIVIPLNDLTKLYQLLG